MKLYINNLLNRLSRYSEKLDKTTLFIDKRWVLIDSESNYHTYIFKKNGELIMSLNGNVKRGKWEYLSGANSILINRVQDEILLNQGFLDKALMVLKYDGMNSNYFILADKKQIPDLDVERYLKSLYYQNEDIITGELTNGKTLEVHRGQLRTQIATGMKVTIDGAVPKDGSYESKGSGKSYEIKKGRIHSIIKTVKYSCTNGQLIEIKQAKANVISKGDLIFIDNNTAPSGMYKLENSTKLKVVDGEIKKVSTSWF